jgi:hypothetical protein
MREPLTLALVQPLCIAYDVPRKAYVADNEAKRAIPGTDPVAAAWAAIRDNGWANWHREEAPCDGPSRAVLLALVPE